MAVQLDDSSLDLLKDHLLSMKNAAIIPSGKEIKMSCPFCGDSRSDPYAASFYINIDKHSETFLTYHCFRASCNAKGIVNDDFMSRIGFFNHKSAKDLTDYLSSKAIKIGGKYVSKKSKNVYNVRNTENKLNDKKLEYINKRLGLNLGYDDLYYLKINLDLIELLKFNDITIPDDKIKQYDYLGAYGVSFISAYNDYLIVRDITGKTKMRYHNINLFDNYDNVTKMYFMPGKLDLLDPDITVINIAEGVFDILGVYYHLNIDRKHKNQMFIAACGSGISSTVFKVIKEYGLLKCKVNIFSDSDVKKSAYEDLRQLKKYLNIFDVTIYYNEKSKDFGVTKSEISTIKSKL